MSYFEEQRQVIEELRQISQSAQSRVSTVPIAENFENDCRTCLTLLGFVPQPFHDKLNGIVSKLRESQGCHYFYPAESFHITIQNVRRIANPPSFNDQDVVMVQKIFREIFKGKKSISFQMKGLLLLSTSISVVCYAEDSYKPLIQEVREKLAENGVPDDKKYVSDKVFFGNITLARFTASPNAALKKTVDSMMEADLGRVELKELSLVTTNSICDFKKTKIVETFKLN